MSRRVVANLIAVVCIVVGFIVRGYASEWSRNVKIGNVTYGYLRGLDEFLTMFAITLIAFGTLVLAAAVHRWASDDTTPSGDGGPR